MRRAAGLGHWTQDRELAATTLEALSSRLDTITAVLVNLVGMFAKNPPSPYRPKPLQFPRPFEPATPPPRTQSTTAEIVAFVRRTGASVRSTSN